MPTNVKVCVNGFVLSTLLFDCTNNTGDQEGFLYGSITRNVRREISDQSMSNTQEDILISICSSVPCGSFLSFYNNVGEIKREDLEYNLGDRVENIIGWYRFRRYSVMFPSVREQAIHRNLRGLFSSDGTPDNSYFVFGLLSSNNLPNFATHSYDYAFFAQKRDSTFRDLPLTILNLGDTRNSYRSGSMALPFMNSSSFNSVLSSSWNFNSFYETENEIHQFHQRLRSKLDSLQEELAASDAVNASLEEDIRRLSNEMQTLLATQERLAAARELELAESEAAAKKLELEEASNSASETCEEEDDDENEQEMVETAEEEPKISEGYVEIAVKEVIVTTEPDNLETDEKNINSESETLDSSKISDADKAIASPEERSIEIHSQSSSDSKVRDPVIHIESDGGNSTDNSTGGKLSGAKNKSVGSPRLKRSSADPPEDSRSTKRSCPDKYFENGDYVEEKSAESTVDEPPSSKQEDSALSNSQLLVVDPDSGETSSALNNGDNLKSDIASCEMEENTIPSPASNVEIIISETGLQSYESAMNVDESMSSSDELSDNKELESKDTLSLLNFEEPSSVSNVKKSLSDSAIICRKEASCARSGSAHAKVLSQLPDFASKSDEESAKVNRPFIIYASKESEDQSEDPIHSTAESSVEEKNIKSDNEIEKMEVEDQSMEKKENSDACNKNM